MKKIKITVMKTAHYQDLIDEYENPISHACDMKAGRVFISKTLEKPEGMCESAWGSLYPFAMTLAYGGGDFYDGWMKNRIPPCFHATTAFVRSAS